MSWPQHVLIRGSNGEGERGAIKSIGSEVLMGHIRYIALGNATVDYVTQSDGRHIERMPGGDAIYAAMGMRIWSREVGVVTIVDRHYPAQWLTALEDAGIDVQGIRRSSLPFGIEAHMVYHADGLRSWSAPRGILGYTVYRVPRLASWFGRWQSTAFSPTAENIPEAYLTADAAHVAPMAVARQNSCLTKLRQHVRTITLDLLPGFLARNAKGDLLIPELKLADVVLPSEQEVHEYWGAVSLADGAAEFRSRGAKRLVVKLGDRGAWIQDPIAQREHYTPVYPASVTDTTGAGYSFCGGFVVGWNETHDILEAALYGTISASFVIEGTGALHTVTVTREQAEDRLQQLRQIMLRDERS